MAPPTPPVWRQAPSGGDGVAVGMAVIKGMAMFDDNPETKWFREFSEIGAARVRGAVAAGGWDREKKQAARRWLERHDLKAWQAGRTDDGGVSWKARLRQSKWWLYVAGALLLLIGASRLFG